MKTIEKRYRKVAGNFLQIRFVRHLDNFVECPVFAPITRTHTNSGGGHVLVIIIHGAFNKLMASRLMKRRRKTHRHVKTNMCWALITCWQVSMFMYDCTNARLLVTRCPSHDDIEENAVDDDDNPSNQLICDSHHARLSLLVQHRNTSLSGQTTHTPTSYARCANTKPRVKIAMKKIGFFLRDVGRHPANCVSIKSHSCHTSNWNIVDRMLYAQNASCSWIIDAPLTEYWLLMRTETSNTLN